MPGADGGRPTVAGTAGGADGIFDVAVVGGGPAGATAARTAARAGARVCLLERADLPRYKTCGGGIVGISADTAGIDLGPLEKARIDTVTFTLDGRFAVTRGRRHRRPILSMVMRDEFDAALCAAARAAGAQIRPRSVVTAVTQDGDGPVSLAVRGAPDVRARVVVGADGSAGRTGTYVGVRCDQVDLGLEGEFPVAGRLAHRWANRVLLDWGPVPGSYAWLFPKGDVLTVGVIGAKDQAPALRAYYADLIDRLGLAGIAPRHDTGHLTRVRTPDSPLRRGAVIVAGDAAGLLEPWTREGISFALRSGRIAGEAAAAAVTDGPAALAAYPDRIEQVLGPEQAAGRRLLAVYARHPEVMHALMVAMPGGFGLFERIISGRSTVARQLRRPVVRAVASVLAEREPATSSGG